MAAARLKNTATEIDFHFSKMKMLGMKTTTTRKKSRNFCCSRICVETIAMSGSEITFIHRFSSADVCVCASVHCHYCFSWTKPITTRCVYGSNVLNSFTRPMNIWYFYSHQSGSHLSVVGSSVGCLFVSTHFNSSFSSLAFPTLFRLIPTGANNAQSHFFNDKQSSSGEVATVFSLFYFA